MDYDEFDNEYNIIEEVEDIRPRDVDKKDKAVEDGKFFTLEIDDDNDCWWLVNGVGSNAARYIYTEHPCHEEVCIKYA
jgi:hypothetical protein